MNESESVEVEQILLAGMMLFPSIRIHALKSLTPLAFHHQDRRDIFQAIEAASKQRDKVDAIDVREELVRVGKLASIGGTAYLGQILNVMQGVPEDEVFALDAIRRLLETTSSEVEP